MSRKAVKERKDSAEMEVESVSEDGRVILHFFGGTRLAFDAHPELARFYRRLISPAKADND
jgi:hypothetical protein